MRSAEVKYCKLSVLQAFFKGLRERQASQNEPKKRSVLAVCYRCNFCPLGLRILSTTGFRLGKCFRYARLFSILEYNFCPINFSVNLIATDVCFGNKRNPLPLRGRYVRDFWLAMCGRQWQSFAGRGECYDRGQRPEVNNILRDLQNSSYPKKAQFNNCFIIRSII